METDLEFVGLWLMKNSKHRYDGPINKVANGVAVQSASEPEYLGDEGETLARAAKLVGPGVPDENSPKSGQATSTWTAGLGADELLGQFLGRARALELLEGASLGKLARSTPCEFARRFGLPPRDSARVAAAFELGRRALLDERDPAPLCGSAEQVFRWVSPELAGLERERFLILLLDGKHRLQRMEQISEGTLTTSLVHPREVFRSAVRESAAALIAVHNHPSGDPEPSAEDLEVTRRLRRAGRLLGIPLLDHVVVGAGRYVSLRDRLW